MPTIGRHHHGSTRDAYPVSCDYCGVSWPRSKLRRDGSGLLACPDEGNGRDARTLDRMNAETPPFRQPAAADAPVRHDYATLSAASGTEVGGTVVAIAGSGLRLTAGVRFGGVSAVYAVISDALINATAPAATFALSSTAADNAVYVTIQNLDGIETPVAVFTYTSEIARILGADYLEEWRPNDPRIVPSAGAVADIPGMNGNGAFVQATSSARPSYSATGYRGGPSIDGNGTTQMMRATLSSPALAGTRPWIGGCFKLPSTADHNYFAELRGTTGDGAYLDLGTEASVFVGYRDDSSGAAVTVASTTATDTDAHTFGIGMSAAGTDSLAVDGTFFNSTATGTAPENMHTATLFGTDGFPAGAAKFLGMYVSRAPISAAQRDAIDAFYRGAYWPGYTANKIIP